MKAPRRLRYHIRKECGVFYQCPGCQRRFSSKNYVDIHCGRYCYEYQQKFGNDTEFQIGNAFYASATPEVKPSKSKSNSSKLQYLD